MDPSSSQSCVHTKGHKQKYIWFYSVSKGMFVCMRFKLTFYNSLTYLVMTIQYRIFLKIGTLCHFCSGNTWLLFFSCIKFKALKLLFIPFVILRYQTCCFYHAFIYSILIIIWINISGFCFISRVQQ
jgi:hypothetical protein